MNYLSVLQPLAPLLSAILASLLVDIILRLVAAARDHIEPLGGIPSGIAQRLLQKLNRQERSLETRLVRGRIALIFMCVVGLILGGILQFVVSVKPAIEMIVWFFCFRLTFIWTACVDLVKMWGLPDKDFVAQGTKVLRRRHVPSLVPSAKPDRHALARTVIEAAAISLYRGWFSPVFWAIVAIYLDWPPLLIGVAVVCVLEAERVIVTQETKDSVFAQGFKSVESFINYVPARVVALFLVIGAVFTPGARPLVALKAMFTQAEAHRSVNAGWPLAAMAGALGVALPGGQVGGDAKTSQWLGPKNARAKASNNDIKRALWLHCVTVAVMALVLTGVLFLSLAA